MSKMQLEIPLSIFAAGCIIFLLSALGSFSLFLENATIQALYKVGSLIGLIGVVAGLIVYSRYKMSQR